MTKINKWQGSPMEQIDINEVKSSLQNCAKNLEKLSKTKTNQIETESIFKV